jgi:hypothetical protein
VEIWYIFPVLVFCPTKNLATMVKSFREPLFYLALFLLFFPCIKSFAKNLFDTVLVLDSS